MPIPDASNDYKSKLFRCKVMLVRVNEKDRAAILGRIGASTVLEYAFSLNCLGHVMNFIDITTPADFCDPLSLSDRQLLFETGPNQTLSFANQIEKEQVAAELHQQFERRLGDLMEDVQQFFWSAELEEVVRVWIRPVETQIMHCAAFQL
jgi:hypothetical protein